MVRGTRDVLDQLLGPSAVQQRVERAQVDVEPRLRPLLDAIERGSGSLAELVDDRSSSDQVLQDLTELELRGLVRREFGGRYVRAVDELARPAAPPSHRRHRRPPLRGEQLHERVGAEALDRVGAGEDGRATARRPQRIPSSGRRGVGWRPRAVVTRRRMTATPSLPSAAMPIASSPPCSRSPARTPAAAPASRPT